MRVIGTAAILAAGLIGIGVIILVIVSAIAS